VSTSERLLGLAVVSALAVVFAHCSPLGALGSECLRYTDCSSGLTCTAGRCEPSTDGADASTDAGADTADGALDGASDAESGADARSDAATVGDSSEPGDAAKSDAPACDSDAGCAPDGAVDDGATAGDAMADAASD
jgi:hypothetical protein